MLGVSTGSISPVNRLKFPRRYSCQLIFYPYAISSKSIKYTSAVSECSVLVLIASALTDRLKSLHKESCQLTFYSYTISSKSVKHTSTVNACLMLVLIDRLKRWEWYCIISYAKKRNNNTTYHSTF
jgi:hypothetical protein